MRGGATGTLRAAGMFGGAVRTGCGAAEAATSARAGTGTDGRTGAATRATAGTGAAHRAGTGTGAGAGPRAA